jgi:putative transposase
MGRGEPCEARQNTSTRRALVAKFVEHCNTVRLHSALGYITPADFLAGRGNEIRTARDRKLEAARDVRARRRAELREAA